MTEGCKNCKHRELPFSADICFKCMLYGGYDNWEPREK